MRKIIAVLAIAALAACGSSPTLEQGEIVEKNYDDADEWYQPGYTIDGGQSCSGGYGNPPSPRVCTPNADIHIPGQWHREDERFLLELKGPNPEDSAKTITNTIEVPESFFNSVRVGQWVDVDSLEVIPR